MEQKNYDYNDLKKTFIKNGIHVYDFTSHAGDRVSFKVRKLDKNIEIRDKIKNATKELEKNGFKLQNHQPNFSKKM